MALWNGGDGWRTVWAEPKAQMDGNIHPFLQENLNVMTQLGIYISTSFIEEMELFRYKNFYVKFMYVEP